MEEPASTAAKRGYSRLLVKKFAVCFFIICITFFASSQSYENLQFIPIFDEQMTGVTVNKMCTFELTIPNVSPALVEISSAVALPKTAVFASLKKSGSKINSGGGQIQGTILLCNIVFLQAGFYTLPPLEIRIAKKNYAIPFEPVEVMENLENLLPEFSLETDGQLYEGFAGRLVLRGRYFKSIEKIAWDLSEFALIEKDASQPVLPAKDYPFSNNLQIAAIFVFTPLFQGTLELPKITISCTAYNGQALLFTAKVKKVLVLPLLQKNKTESSGGIEFLNSAKTAAQIGYTAEDTSIGTRAALEEAPILAEKLAALRIKERLLLFPFFVRAERMRLEKEAELYNPGEQSFVWTIIGGVFFIPCLIGGFLLHKKPAVRLVCFSLCLILFLFVLSSSIRLQGQYALTIKGFLKNIPEQESKDLMSLAEGMRVRILRSNGNWYLISLDKTCSGWILKSGCVLIR